MAEHTIIDAVSSKYVPSWGNAKQFIAVHYLGVTGESHELSSDGTGAHYYIYHDGTIYQRCDHDAIVWQVGTAGCYTQKHATARNANCIGIEMCAYCDGDKTSATDPYWYFTEETQEACAWLVQKLMKDLNIPADNVLRHWDIVNKVCPAPYYANNGYKTSWTWDEFKAKISGESTEAGEAQWYRVRLAWDDADSQIGAFLDKNNAISACLPGYTVYDWEGNAVYTNEASGTQASEFAGMKETDAAAKILEICAPISIAYGLFPSVCAAQTILESGYCTTDLAVNANNVAGMKTELSGNTWSGSTWDGTSKYTKDTTEQDENGNPYTITADFRKYPCIEDSIKDRCAYLLGAMNGSELRYKGITDCADYKAQAQLIKDGGYATDVSYVSKLCSLIEQYDLAVYDGEVAPAEPEPETTGDGWYRVRLSWENAESQIGAFQIKDNAIACAKENLGYNVYDENGNEIYTGTVYYVQAGAFAVEKNAEKRISDLKAAGFDVFLKYEEDGMYHVQCGAFSELKNAEALASKLRSAGFEAIVK